MDNAQDPTGTPQAPPYPPAPPAQPGYAPPPPGYAPPQPGYPPQTGYPPAPPGPPGYYQAPPGGMPPKKGGKGALIAVISVLVVAALGVGGYFLWQALSDDDGGGREKDEKVDPKDQVEAAADFFEGWYIEDPELLKSALPEDLEDMIDELGLEPLDGYEVEREWDDDVLTVIATWDGEVDVEATFESDGDEKKPIVTITNLDEESGGEEIDIALKLEDDRWVVTEFDGDAVDSFLEESLSGSRQADPVNPDWESFYPTISDPSAYSDLGDAHQEVLSEVMATMYPDFVLEESMVKVSGDEYVTDLVLARASLPYDPSVQIAFYLEVEDDESYAAGWTSDGAYEDYLDYAVASNGREFFWDNMQLVPLHYGIGDDSVFALLAQVAADWPGSVVNWIEADGTTGYIEVTRWEGYPDYAEGFWADYEYDGADWVCTDSGLWE